MKKNNALIAMPMFGNGETYQLDDVIQNLKSFWGLPVAEINGDNETAFFNVDGESVAVLHVPDQIPWGDIDATAQYAYNWPNAREELKDHNGHAIVSVMPSDKPVLERFKILSKVLYAILSTSDTIGIYQGTQSLLIPRSQYLGYVDELKEDTPPVPLWIYFGLRASDNGNSLYTYGLAEFGKQELEILNSQLELEELYDFACNLATYVVGNDVTLKSGETLGYTADQKINITSSKGVFVDGDSLKLEM